MKKEAVSVLKPHNGKTLKNKVHTNPKKNIGKIEKRVAVTEPRGGPKVKVVKAGDSVKKPKATKSDAVDQPIVENPAKKKKIANLPAGKITAVREGHIDEARVQPKKKLKTQPEEPTAIKKSQKKTEVKPVEKMPPTEAEPAKAPKKRKGTVNNRKSIENVGDLKMTKKHVLKSIQCIQQLSLKEQDSKKSLLPTDTDPLYLQVECIRIAKCPRRQIRPYLPHQLAGPSDDVALFVCDLQRGRRRDYEQTVDHWETILREKGVDCIKEVIPLNRVKTEYNQYEMQRKLAMSFDYFLADARIIGHLTHLLGKNFYKRRCAPTPVKLQRDNLKGEFNFALHKTCMEIHAYGNSHTMRVGTLSMDAKKIAENVWAACEELRKQYPGGWNNIRSLRLKATTGLAIPIYITLVSKNNVPIPVVKPKRPRAYETVEGELTTVPGGAKVKLTPEGGIRVKRLKDYGDVEEEDDEEDEEEEENVKGESEGEEAISDNEQ